MIQNYLQSSWYIICILFKVRLQYKSFMLVLSLFYVWFSINSLALLECDVERNTFNLPGTKRDGF